MQRRMLLIVLTLSLFPACRPATPQPSTPASATATAAVSPTTRPTPTFIAQLSPLATSDVVPSSKFQFTSNYRDGLPGFDIALLQDGVYLEIIKDQPNSNRASILRGTILGPPVESEGEVAYRGFPTKSFPFVSFPCRVQQDVWMSRGMFEDVRIKGDWYSQLALYDTTPDEGGRWHVSAATELWPDGHIHLDVKGSSGDGVYFPPVVEGAPHFTPEKWHTMALDADAAGIVSLYQDNQFISKGALEPASRKGIARVHGGPVHAHGDFRAGDYALVDNLIVACGE